MCFHLPQDDTDFLDDSFNKRWKRIADDKERGIVIEGYLLPEGYNQSEAEMMLLIPLNYPMAALDMFYVSPDITKVSGNDIAALDSEVHLSRKWQRWSRHYDWLEGIHNIATHLAVVENALRDELQR